jgi:hypothetical protein
MAGRPTKYSKELADEICTRISDGESLVSICRGDHMPSRVTIYAWLDAEVQDEELNRERQFLNRYARARELQADSFFDEAVFIADNTERDTYKIEIAEGVEAEKVDHEAIQRSKLRVDTRLRIAAVSKPEKYSEKKLHELTGRGGAPISIEAAERPQLSKEEWLKLHGLDGKE